MCLCMLHKVVSGSLPFCHFQRFTHKSSWNKTFSIDSDIYFVSQSNTVLAIWTSSARLSTSQSHPRVNWFSRMYLVGELLQRTSLALILITLAGDVELNPGFCHLVDVKNTPGLKVAHLNVRSLWNKVDLLRFEWFDNIAIDVLTLSETWLDSNIQDSEICLSGFTLVRQDREGSKSGEGVAIYVRDGLPFCVRNDIDSGENECLWMGLNRAKWNSLTLICCLYCAPNADFTKFIFSLENCMPTLIDVI